MPIEGIPVTPTTPPTGRDCETSLTRLRQNAVIMALASQTNEHIRKDVTRVTCCRMHSCSAAFTQPYR